jgi:hypothetical protein
MEVGAIAGPGSALEAGESGGDETSQRRPPPTQGWRAATDDYEYQPLRIDARVSRSAAAAMLAIRAEFSGWELARVLRFPDGSRRVWLRRRRSPGLLPDLTP